LRPSENVQDTHRCGALPFVTVPDARQKVRIGVSWFTIDVFHGV
jgi:hypothetical protein